MKIGKPKPITKKVLEHELKKLPAWSLAKNGTVLTKKFEFKTHVEALVAIARITVYAEVNKHHPDILFTYKTVKVSLTTKEVKGLTNLDITLAGEINRRLVDKQIH